MDLRITSYGSLKFLGEVQARQACVKANQQELTTCAKKWRQEEKILFCKGWVWSIQPWHYQSDNLTTFEFFYFSFLFFFGVMRKFGDGPDILEEWVYNTPIFWSLPLHLKVLNLPFLMELGDFIFFQFFC